jgi:hypothetical protein
MSSGSCVWHVREAGGEAGERMVGHGGRGERSWSLRRYVRGRENTFPPGQGCRGSLSPRARREREGEKKLVTKSNNFSLLGGLCDAGVPE